MKRIIVTISSAAAIIAIGLFLLLVVRTNQTGIVTPAPTAAEITAAQAVTPTPTPAPEVVVQTGEPQKLSIPSLNINLDITPGVYNTQTQQWTLTSDKAQYAVVTPKPNNVSGNTFIYGHYRKGVFATLHTIPANAEAMIQTDNGKTFTYRLSAIRVVSPEDSEAVFNYDGAPILTIQTCTGLLFQDRQLFTFNLEKVS